MNQGEGKWGKWREQMKEQCNKMKEEGHWDQWKEQMKEHCKQMKQEGQGQWGKWGEKWKQHCRNQDGGNGWNFGWWNHGRNELKAHFIKENQMDGVTLLPSQTLVWTWTFRNEGGVAWPETVQLIPTSGDNLNGVVIQVPTINVGDEIDISQTIKAPEAPGVYRQDFRLFDGTNYFGHGVWAEISVVEVVNGVEIKHPAEPVLANGAEEVKVEPKNEEHSSLFQQPQPIVPELKAEESVEDSNLKFALDTMEEMGLTNREMNKILITKYKDVTEVINRIVNNDLSNSAFSP